MACSHCGQHGHNVQTCDRVRRCSCCNRRGHDRRNCPDVQLGTRDGAVVGPCSNKQIAYLCRGRETLLAHLYWSGNTGYFEDNLASCRVNGGWKFVATPGHGVHAPTRPTINFFVADGTFADSYEEAAASRGFKHGVLIRRAAVERVASAVGFECANVQVGYPHSYGERNPETFWRFDLGNHRFKSVATLRFATVVRLATPEQQRLRTVRLSQDAVVAWW